MLHHQLSLDFHHSQISQQTIIFANEFLLNSLKHESRLRSGSQLVKFRIAKLPTRELVEINQITRQGFCLKEHSIDRGDICWEARGNYVTG